MKKLVALFLLLMGTVGFTNAQKFAIVDMEYILKHDVFYYSAGRFDGADGQSEIYDSKKGVRGAFNSRVLYNDTFYTTFTYGLDALNDVTSQPLLDGRIWVPKMHMLGLRER